MTLSPTWADHAARAFEPPAPRTWPTPLAMAEALDPATRSSPALHLLADHLATVGDTPGSRLMWFMPPQEGKSQQVSRRFPAWLLHHDPSLRIVIVSYESERAVRWGRQIKRDVEQHPELAARIRLMPDSKAAGRWHTDAGGGVYCAGIGGPITGEPADVLIIDDPVKGRAQAESELYRKAAWEWWENTGQPRLSGRSRVVLVMTRWHKDDLAGKLLKAEPGEWTVVRIPAVAGVDDPLDRAPGVELESVQDRPPGWFARLAAKVSRYVWQSVYQQSPTAAEGNLLQRSDFRYWSPGPAGMLRLGEHTHRLVDGTRFITIDLAASTKRSADFTVAAAWYLSPHGDLVLLDRARARVTTGGHFDLVTPLRQRWLAPHDVTWVESAAFGTTFVYAAGRSGIPLAPLDADSDKVTRALALAGLVRQHKVWWPADADWIDEWCDELAEFPTAAHDDQVDVAAYAARVAITHWSPASATAPHRRASGDDDIDLMNVPM